MISVDVLKRDALLHIDLENGAAFQGIFTHLCDENRQSVASELAVRLLAEQKQELLRPNPDRSRYEFILKNLKAIFPDIKTHFSRNSKIPKDSTMEGLNMHAISSKGQRVVIDSYRKKDDLNGKKVTISENFFRFQESIRNFFTTAQEGEEQLFLVRHRQDPKKNPTDTARHTSPIHVIRKGNVFKLLVTDSHGGQSRTKPDFHYIQDLIDIIRAAYTESNSELSIEINYDGGLARLGDWSNCVILAIREGLEMIRNTDHVYSWIEEKRIPQSDGTYAVPYLPLRMVKAAQSIKYIDSYLNETNQNETKLESNKKQAGETIPEALKRHQYVTIDPKSGNRKVVNGKVAHTYLKYERLIIAHCIENAEKPKAQ